MKQLSSTSTPPPFLNPTIFAQHMYAPAGEQISPAVAHTILPVVLSLIQLRRTMTTVIEGVPNRKAFIIGAEIPPAKRTYLELGMDNETLKAYSATHQVCAGSLGAGIDETTESPMLNMTVHRRLCQAVTNPNLDHFFCNSRGIAPSVDAYYPTGRDYGATLYYHNTKTAAQKALPAPGDRICMAIHLTRNSPKLKLMLSMAHEICNTNGRKLLVFADWPLTQRDIEMILQNAGFNVLGLRASHKVGERDTYVDEFNDPASALQMLVPSLRISSVAINLQACCSDVIFVDVPGNA